ncbi:hypothetical protein M2319_003779 [Rhodobium gokarnense]|uniref:Uncharacterized protein n=1 Tax=Rhodobium gokarnense TaxID=364296 RepID=A0ABT3HGB9_9HYPH|nr:hypothetical protein [Rhodobium gokarnense]
MMAREGRGPPVCDVGENTQLPRAPLFRPACKIALANLWSDVYFAL